MTKHAMMLTMNEWMNNEWVVNVSLIVCSEKQTF